MRRYGDRVFGLTLLLLLLEPVPGALAEPGSTLASRDAPEERAVPVRSDLEEGRESLAPPMVWIPAGAFTMGSPPGESCKDSDENQHVVILSHGFYICETEVTQEQWKSMMGYNPSRFWGHANLPVENVTWYETVDYCNALSMLEGREPAYEIDGQRVTWLPGTDGFRLPTESEWEYACRAGSKTAFYNAAVTDCACNDPNLYRIAWYCGDFHPARTKAVGQKQPNAWGLYDTSGNVREWCWDRYEYQYPEGPVIDPTGGVYGLSRVMRGGYWMLDAKFCRSADRYSLDPEQDDPNVGFRIVRSAP
jgi:formylglycine-generating enzyme required for sulfatase activity